MRDRYAEEHRRQSQTCDSGMGTSVGDSESEAESLTEHVHRTENEDNAARNANGDNSSDDEERNAYNYGAESDEEPEDSSASDEESEEDEFMKDRQTDEDYSAYRERIFDFTPKGYKQKKSLVEEINDGEVPSTSRIQETPTTSEENTVASQNIQQDISENSTNNRSNMEGDAFNFQMMVEHMCKVEGIRINNENSSNGENTVGTDETQMEETKNYMQKQREALVSEAVDRVKKLDVSSLTFDEYMTSLDKPAPCQVENPKDDEESEEESVENCSEMTKNIAQDKVEGPGVSQVDKVTTNITLKDIMKKNNVIHAESDSDDSDSSDDEPNVTEMGDGHPVCRLRNPEEIEDILKEILTTPKFIQNEEEVSIVCKCKEESLTPSDTHEDVENQTKEISNNISTEPEQKDMNDEETKHGNDTNFTNDKFSVVNEVLDVISQTEEQIPIVCNYKEESMTLLKPDEDVNTEAKELSSNISIEPEQKDVNNAEENKKDNIINNDKIHIINEVADDSDSGESEESEESSDEAEKPFYRKLDKSKSTQLKQVDETTGNVTVKTKEEIKEALTDGNQEAEKEEEQDASYREMLKWNIKLPPQNVQILSPIGRKESEEDFKNELCDMIAQTKKENKPEFEITPPKDIAEENDKIMYARNTKQSICSVKYKSMFTESGKTPDVKPPLVHKVLKLSQNYPIFQKNQNDVVKVDTKEEVSTPENALEVSNKISEVREYMAQFTKNLEEFNERSRLAREVVIKDYNDAVERELKIVDKLMKTKKYMFDKKYKPIKAMKNRRVDHMDENVMRKHFEDMDMILEEDSSDEEEKLKATMDQMKKEYMEELGQYQNSNEHVMGEPKKSNSDGEEETEDEEEKKDEEKTALSDKESYEECMTANEENEQYEDAVIGTSETNSNAVEKSVESCEEYFTTNEEELDEYYDTDDVKQEETNEASIEKPVNYQQFVDKIRKQNEEKSNEEDQCDDKVEDNESVLSQYNEKEIDDNVNVNTELENYEKAVVKRTVNCSLEMQLAKKTDDEI